LELPESKTSIDLMISLMPFMIGRSLACSSFAALVSPACTSINFVHMAMNYLLQMQAISFFFMCFWVSQIIHAEILTNNQIALYGFVNNTSISYDFFYMDKMIIP
jgi:hypothetical protein